MKSLIAYHASGYTVGIHPSWQSGDEEAVLMDEVDELTENNRISGKIQPAALYTFEFAPNIPQTD